MNLQEQMDALNLKINGEKNNQMGDGHPIMVELLAEKEKLQNEIDLAAQQQAHVGRMEEATQTIGYILDTMTVEGLTIAEIITNDDEYKLVRKGVQDAFIAQAETYSKSISDVQAQLQNDVKAITERATIAEGQVNQLQTANSELEVKNYELTITNDDLNGKVTKGAELLAEATAQIEQLKGHISDLQNQIALGVRGSLNVVNMPQDTSKAAADIIARKVRIKNVQFKDETGIDRRIKTAEVVLTGEHIEYEAIYEKRYIILTDEEAAAYVAEKKAEEEAAKESIPSIPEIKPLETPEITAVQEVHTFPTEIQASAIDGVQSDIRDGDHNKVAGQNAEAETPTLTLESLKAELDAIKAEHGARLDNIERHANLPLTA